MLPGMVGEMLPGRRKCLSVRQLQHGTGSLGSWHSTTELRPQALSDAIIEGCAPRSSSFRSRWIPLQALSVPLVTPQPPENRQIAKGRAAPADVPPLARAGGQTGSSDSRTATFSSDPKGSARMPHPV